MLDCDVERTRKSHVRLMFNTLAVLGYILEDVDPARATTLRESARPAASSDAMVWAAITTTGGDGSSNAKAREELDMGTS